MTAALPPLPTRLSGDDPAVRTRALHKRFGDHVALHDVHLEVPRSAVYLLVGPNGAGKSTTIKILLDLVRADAGTAEVLGLHPVADGPLLRANTGYVPDRNDWGFGWMRVGRLLEHQARYFTSWDPVYAASLARRFELSLDRRMGKLSKGQARRVHLAMALAHRPALLLLDEPTDGLDPLVRDEVLGTIAEHLADTPTTVLLSTHHVTEVERLADHIGVMRDGRLRAQLPIDALRRNLRRYRVAIPAGWQGDASLGGALLRRSAAQEEHQWTVWGDEREIAGRLAAAGATVRDAAPLSLHDATLALLAARGEMEAA